MVDPSRKLIRKDVDWPFASPVDDVGPVQRVIEAAPACVCRVERKPGIAHRDDELRPGDFRDLGVDTGGFNLERRSGFDQVLNSFQELDVMLMIE